MKLLIYISLFPFLCFSQVGIGTITPDPATHLDVQGLLQISANNEPTFDKMLVIEDTINGTIGWRDIPDGISANVLISSAELNMNSYGSSVNFTSTGAGVWNATDLDLNAVVNTTLINDRVAFLDIRWSIPISSTDVDTDAYVGISLFIGGLEVSSAGYGSAVVRIKGENTTTIVGSFWIWVLNNTGANYSLPIEAKGDIHQISAGLLGSTYELKYHPYEKGTLNVQTFRKHL